MSLPVRTTRRGNNDTIGSREGDSNPRSALYKSAALATKLSRLWEPVKMIDLTPGSRHLLTLAYTTNSTLPRKSDFVHSPNILYSEVREPDGTRLITYRSIMASKTIIILSSKCSSESIAGSRLTHGSLVGPSTITREGGNPRP